ncbi:hypothetical protein RHMOL_Rhmol07G0206700 [Rhododendron molle]|uniref:Uncharacterized protein n=1 Tax=Rhododendron molle TaxID=49168 RepID=A0ACC0N3K1_RHOML|nr:hypothetical protein RHMOL_Rhmol07G0206700 [Rhododendron molle]
MPFGYSRIRFRYNYFWYPNTFSIRARVNMLLLKIWVKIASRTILIFFPHQSTPETHRRYPLTRQPCKSLPLTVCMYVNISPSTCETENLCDGKL